MSIYNKYSMKVLSVAFAVFVCSCSSFLDYGTEEQFEIVAVVKESVGDYPPLLVVEAGGLRYETPECKAYLLEPIEPIEKRGDILAVFVSNDEVSPFGSEQEIISFRINRNRYRPLSQDSIESIFEFKYTPTLFVGSLWDIRCKHLN